MGWDGYHNGNLLELAKGHFDVLITRDQSIPFQQNLTDAGMALIILFSRSNSMTELEPLVPSVLDTLNAIRSGDVIRIYANPQ